MRCTRSDPPLRYLDVDDGDLNDVVDIRATSMRSIVHAEPGADVVLGGGGSDAIYGEDGNDT